MANEFVVIGDLHFGIKGFNDDFLDNQLRFFNEQLFPYMKEKGITKIVQMGDLLDNRKIINIRTFNRLCDEFFSKLEENNFTMYSLLGNHDIYYSSTLDINMVKYFQRLYPDNFILFSEPTIEDINGVKIKFFPWLINSTLEKKDLSGVDMVFGHFEIKNFEMVKGHVDDKSDLSSKFFQSIKGLKRVVSGHYHVQSTDGFVTYVGTPYQINWGDYNTPRGFFVFNGIDYEFIENEKSAKFIKLKYDDSCSKPLELSGYYKKGKRFSKVSEIPDLSNHYVKFFINEAKNKDYEVCSFDLHHAGVSFDMINNVEISDLIGTDFQGEIENIGGAELLIRTVKDKKPHLVNLLDTIMSEVDEK